jgi:hypothetical protein
LQVELLLVSPPAVQFGYCRALEAVSVSPDALALIVSWVGRHQVVRRRFPETETGFWQVVHLKEWTLLRLQGHRSFEIVVHQCGVPAVDGGLQQQGPKVEVAGVKPAQRVWSDSDHQIAVGVAYGVNHGAGVVVADGILTSEYLYAVVIDEGVGVLDGFHVVTREQFASMS